MAQTQTIIKLDATDLENKIKNMYKNVAQRPNDTYHFELGKNLAIKLGYPKNIKNSMKINLENHKNYYKK